MSEKRRSKPRPSVHKDIEPEDISEEHIHIPIYSVTISIEALYMVPFSEMTPYMNASSKVMYRRRNGKIRWIPEHGPRKHKKGGDK